MYQKFQCFSMLSILSKDILYLVQFCEWDHLNSSGLQHHFAEVVSVQCIYPLKLCNSAFTLKNTLSKTQNFPYMVTPEAKFFSLVYPYQTWLIMSCLSKTKRSSEIISGFLAEHSILQLNTVKYSQVESPSLMKDYFRETLKTHNSVLQMDNNAKLSGKSSNHSDLHFRNVFQRGY